MDAPGLEVRFARSEHERDDAEDVLVRALGGAGAQALCGQPRTTADRARCRRELDLALARPELAGDIKAPVRSRRLQRVGAPVLGGWCCG
jgi:hypothetical protein